MTRPLNSGVYRTQQIGDQIQISKPGSPLVATLPKRDWAHWFSALGHIEAAERIWTGAVRKRLEANE